MPIDRIYTLKHRVGYFQVDQDHRIHLSSLFKLLQEAAIQHATQGNIGTQIMEEKGESWILNRVVMQLDRYPRFDESLTIQTWATQMKHFKGFREFRILAGEELLGKVSTLWLYINMKEKAIARLPGDTVKYFPTRPNEIFFEDLDRLRLKKPGPEAKETQVTLRYSDIDGNQHVNNAAYMDFLQTALYHQNLNTRPKELQIQFSKEISPQTNIVSVHLTKDKERGIFGINSMGDPTASGTFQ